MNNTWDLIINGGGSAAFPAAIKANELKLNTLLINGGLPLGGTCVNIGCVPSKFLIRAAENIYHSSYSPFEGIEQCKPKIDFGKIIRQKKQLVADMQKRKYVDLLSDLEFVTVAEGDATFKDKNTVVASDTEYNGLKFIIATGSTTAIPPIEGLDSVQYFTNDTLFDLEEQPQSLIIVGGGYMGLEIAQAYNRFGTDVTILEALNEILSTETENITKTIKATHLLIATGRKANTQNFGLERVGVKTAKKGYIEVNEMMETSIDNIYAIGDVTNLPAFVYTAATEGGIAVGNAFQDNETKLDLNALPWVVFTDPQIAGVGMDEKAAKEKNIPYEVTLLPLSDVPRSIVSLNTRGFIKLIKNPETDLLLGARIIAPEGSELAMEISLAIKNRVSVKQLAEAMHPYLTLSEGIKLAAMSFTTDVKKMSCCAS